MAAHVATALNQIKEHIEQGKPIASLHLDGALALSCWTEDLDLDDYSHLRHLWEEKNPVSMLKWVDLALRKYTQVWEQIDKPYTREEWRQRYLFDKGWKRVRVTVDWEGNVWGKGEFCLALAQVPCQCMKCHIERVKKEADREAANV